MWGEGINEDNFEQFVWRPASAAVTSFIILS